MSFAMVSETGKAVAITLGFVAGALYLPVFGAALSLFLPLPVLFFRARLGRTGGAATMAGGVALLWFWAAGGAGRMEALFYFDLLLLGFLMGELLTRRFPVELVVGFSAVAAMAGAGLLFWTVQSATAGALVQDFRATLGAILDMVIEAQKEMGAEPARQNFLAENRDLILTGWLRLMPAMAAVLTLLSGWVNLLTARGLFAARGMTFPDYGPLSRWKAPEPLVWGAIAFAVLALPESTRLAGFSGLLILGTVYFFQGVAIVEYWLRKKNAPRPLRVFMYLLIVLQQILLLVIVAVGFFDLWADFRRLRKTEEPQ